MVAVPTDSKAVYTLLSSIAVAGLLDRASRAAANKKTEQQLEALRGLQQGLRHIGGIAAAVDWFVGNCDGLVSVQKLVQHPPGGRPDRFTPVASIFGQAVAKCLDQGCQWEEIALFGQMERITEPDTGLTVNQLANYRASYLDIDVPIPQVFLMTWKARSAVMLGFTFDGGGQRDSVFLSEDKGTVDYFMVYFESLHAKSTPITTLRPVPDRPPRRLFSRGRWLSAG